MQRSDTPAPPLSLDELELRLAAYMRCPAVPRYVQSHCPACPAHPAVWVRSKQMRRERCFDCALPMARLPLARWRGRPVVFCARCARHAVASAAHFSVDVLRVAAFACPRCGEPAVPVALTNDRGAERIQEWFV